MVRHKLVLTVLCVAFAAGCSQSVPGDPVAQGLSSGDTGGPGRHIDADVDDLVLSPDQFPAPYSAVVVPREQIGLGMAGVPQGGRIEPEGCTAPLPDLNDGKAAYVVGTDSQTQSTVTAGVIRTDRTVASFREQVESCPDITMTTNTTTARVHRELGADPAVDADDSLDMTMTVKSGQGSRTVDVTVLMLVAQVGDVWVTSMFMSFTGAEPDRQAVEDVLTKSVAKVDAA
ncbi:hypothetical protein [Antrihabitans sp. YC2-6]|uniref:hypothetical protein n=1 Tax=Antrihabitans sp. YC2-6 TaxID=2799498 RepID=UPI0018F616D1|nr:hypothetical protein [Antrihabitans sp. YC2-6]MBJ8345046.1 hypothetical protein [Antrihabitans sp. YC2-6]